MNDKMLNKIETGKHFLERKPLLALATTARFWTPGKLPRYIGAKHPVIVPAKKGVVIPGRAARDASRPVSFRLPT